MMYLYCSSVDFNIPVYVNSSIEAMSDTTLTLVNMLPETRRVSRLLACREYLSLARIDIAPSVLEMLLLQLELCLSRHSE